MAHNRRIIKENAIFKEWSEQIHAKRQYLKRLLNTSEKFKFYNNIQAILLTQFFSYIDTRS